MKRLLDSRRRAGRHTALVLMAFVSSQNVCLLANPFVKFNETSHRSTQPLLEKEAESSKSSSPPVSPADKSIHRSMSEAYDRLPLSFEVNEGQHDGRVKFLSRGSGFNLFLTPEEAVMVMSKTVLRKKKRAAQSAEASSDSKNTTTSVLRMKLLGANSNPRIVGTDQLPGRSNYFIGNDPTKWKTNVRNYGKIKYEQVYPGVDMVYYGNQQELEYDFIIAPGSDPRQIGLHFDGARKLRIDRHGNLVVAVSGGEVRQHKPTVYQEVEGRRKEIAVRYILKGRLSVGFALGEYDGRIPLIIDPILTYSTYVSSMSHSIALDAVNNIYITGYAVTTTFPVVNAVQPTYGGGSNDAFVTKLNAAGSTRIYSTYLGGSVTDAGDKIAVDPSGNATVAGYTFSTNFPTFNALDATYNGNGDAFVAKLNATGAFIYSTFLGGPSQDATGDVVVNSLGNAYVTGLTFSPNFPTLNPIQPPACNGNNADAFLTAINSTGTAYLYSTHIGGTNNDSGLGITLDATGNLYVTGSTWSTDFPLVNPTQPTKTGTFEDAFILKVNPAGTALLFSTYLGGNVGDVGYDIAVDGAGNAFVVGTTESLDFPTTPNAYRTTHSGYQDAFIAKVDTVAPMVVYSTYLGGNNHDGANGVVIDSQGCAIIAGGTASTNFPLVNPIQSQYGGIFADAFVARLNQTGSSLTFSTFLGGNGTEGAQSIVLDATETAYITGQTDSTNFPLVSPLQTTIAEGFIAKISGLVAYSVSGQVLGADNLGMNAVTMSLSGSASGTTQTDNNGNYTFLNVPAGGSYTVTPSKPPFTFVPTNRTFNNLSSNQTGDFTVVAYSVSGRVTNSSGAGVSGATLTLSGSQTGTAQTDASGNYSFPAVAKGGNYTITPSKPDPLLTYIFAPTNRSITNLNADTSLMDFTSTTSIITSLNPSADAYVQDGASANTNFGTVTPLLLKTDNSTGQRRDVYLKFDVSALSTGIVNAKLRIYAALSSSPGSISTSAYSVTNTGWLESGTGSITWNNKPPRNATAITGSSATVTSTNYASYDLDVTSYIVSEKAAGRDVVSLALHNPSNSNNHILMNSREAALNKPRLVVTTSSTINLFPAVSISSPSSGTSFTAPASIVLNANATDSDGSIGSVTYYAGTIPIGTSTTGPLYQVTWPSVGTGSYTLFAVATDNSGATTTSSPISVNVNPTNTAPAVFIAAPLEGTIFSAGSNISLDAKATEIDGTVSKVEFFAGSTLVGTATTPGPEDVYSVTWNNVATGACALTAKATDNANGVTTSAAVNISVVSQTGLSPAADAYVRDGSSASTNFGTSNELQTQVSTTAGSNRESYLKFNLATVSGIARAKLRLYGKLSDTSGTNVAVAAYPAGNTNWPESGSGSINWNNKPTANPPSLSQVTVTDNIARWYELDVTSYITSEKTSGHDLVTIALKGLAASNPYVTFNSKEVTTATDNRPQLVLWTTQTRNALLVVGSSNLNPGDNAAKTRLQNLGFTVTVKVANTGLVTADADGKAIVVISSTSTASNVTNKFRYVCVPVVIWEFDVFDDMGMTGTGSGDFGSTTQTQTALQIINSTHPLAAGLANQPTVVNSGTNFSWGNPNLNSAKIATVVGDANKIVIFGYDNGVAMSGLNAPSRRVGLFMTDVTVNNLNASGGLLFDAAVKWATEVITAPVINSVTPGLAPVGTTVTITGVNFGSAQGGSTLTFNGLPANTTSWTDRSIVSSVPLFATTGPLVITVSGISSNGVVFAVGEVDSDGDGLPDSWEIQYFGNLNQTASGDPDGDGLSNLQEFQQGRNPTKSALSDPGDFVNLKVHTPLSP